METLGNILVIVLLLVIALCLVKIEQHVKIFLIERSERKTAARREASRSRIYPKVKKEYAVNRNRRKLWEEIENKEVRK